MMKLKYNSDEGRAMAAQISRAMRDAAYEASVELAIEKGPFPLFDADKYLGLNRTAPAALPRRSRHASANTAFAIHTCFIAPTGTISLAFADNASNGIEPPFSWFYTRKKRMADGTHKEYLVEDHAYRLYRTLGHDVSQLPEYFVSALEMSANDHMLMCTAVGPYIDTAISKTVNVPLDYPVCRF